MLDLSKIESGANGGRTELLFRRKSSPACCRSCKWRAAEKGLHLICEWPQGVPERICTDALRLKQLLVNLLGNAVKFSGGGDVRLVCQLLADQDQPQMAFQVIDSGIGIASDKLDSIFDAFVQADSSVTREFGGTGLGLGSPADCPGPGWRHHRAKRAGQRQHVHRHYSDRPLTNVAILPRRSQRPWRPRWNRQPGRRSIFVSRFLLVDNGSVNRKLLTLFLAKTGGAVTPAENGQIGVELATSQPFDLILMDMQMPVMDGYTAVARLRELGIATPVIALTAHAMNGRRRSACRRAARPTFPSRSLPNGYCKPWPRCWPASSPLVRDRQGSIPIAAHKPSR